MSKVITIAQQKGGSGKTTIAANLAAVYSLKNNLSTTLLDTDPQGSLGKWFLTRNEKLKNKNTIQFKTASLWGAQYEAKSLKEKSDLVIIDTPPKIDADGRPAIEIADLVIIPISPSQVDFWATESIIELAKREKREILILINRANAKSKLIQEAHKFVNKMNVKKAKTILGNRQIFVSSMGLGLTVVEKQRTGKGCLEMLALAREIQSFLKFYILINYMNEEIDNGQLHDTCSRLLKGFINWIEINDSKEKASILDNAFQFKKSILEQDKSTLQKKYFTSPQNLSKKEAEVLLLQWKDTFSTLVNSNVDRLSKDSFKIWFLSLASYSIPELEKDANELWSKLLEGVEYCNKFSIKDVPYPLNTISKN